MAHAKQALQKDMASGLRPLALSGDEDDLKSRLARLLVGQPDAIEDILPLVKMYQSGLAPDGRPVGNVLLLGPTGTGKTHTVEALADVLHGSPKNLLKIDCGEFQRDYEIAKLIGAPPGYLGHRETQPRLSQAAINSVSSESCDISLILFDEIEKANDAMTQLLLGVLDKAALRLGDNSSVNFERCLIFLTTNLGAKQMQAAAIPNFGLASGLAPTDATGASVEQIKRIGVNAVRRKFSPEFVNRLDAVITYRALDRQNCEVILQQMMDQFARLIISRLGMRGFRLACTDAARKRLLDLGVSLEYGARELRRTVERSFIQPVAALVAEGQIPPGCTVLLDTDAAGEFQIFRRI